MPKVNGRTVRHRSMDQSRSSVMGLRITAGLESLSEYHHKSNAVPRGRDQKECVNGDAEGRAGDVPQLPAADESDAERPGEKKEDMVLAHRGVMALRNLLKGGVW